MARNHTPRILENLHEDATGVLHLAKDSSGRKVWLRKAKPTGGQHALPAVEQVAYQVAIERLIGIHHPSLLSITSGGCDPEDGLPYIATKPAQGEVLADRLKRGPLSIELATALVSQALEVSELLSYLLADDGIWIETESRNILLTERAMEPCFLFWPSPIKAMPGMGRTQCFADLIDLTERVMNWTGKEVEEREGGHLLMWLKWLKGPGRDASVREARDMLAAAAGVEPPDPIETLAEQCQRRPGSMSWLPQLPAVFHKWQAPKMPLFTLLSVMLVIQAIIGWFIVRSINERVDEQLNQLNATYTASPYTIDRDPDRKPEPGSEPLDFD